MTFVSDFLPTLSELRAIPGQMGLRQHSVYLSERSWSGNQIGDGAMYEDEVQLLEGDRNPKVRQLNDERLALGNLAAGSLEIGPITPGISTTTDKLRGTELSLREGLHVRVTGPMGNNYYTISKLVLDKALRWMITVQPVGTGG